MKLCYLNGINMYQTSINQSTDKIDNLISVIRARIGFGQTKFEIARDLGRKHPQDVIHFAYVAAKMLSDQ